MIKPEDISQEQAKMLELWDVEYGDAAFFTPERAAYIANQLIASGIVSPRVWVVRSRSTGKLLNQTSRRITKPDNTDDMIFEHWKGQAE
jgi:hypothetical protein